MSFLDSIKSRELKGLVMAAIECLAALESINRLAMESDGESSQPEGDQPDAQRQRLKEFQLSVAQLFDARIKLKETLPELEAYLIQAVPCEKNGKMVLGRPTPSLCRGLLRLANDVLSAINWPGRRPGTTINTDAAEEALYDYMEYAIEEFVVYEDCDEMDYADERSGLGVMGVVLIPELTRHVFCELTLADKILAGGGPELAAGGSESSKAADTGEACYLEQTDAAILGKLLESRPVLQTIERLGGELALSNPTVGASLKRLKEAGLICHPNGERKGCQLSDKGVAAAKSLPQSRG